jgi:hypothetical protein
VNVRPSIQLQVVDQHHYGNTSIKGTVFTAQCVDDQTASAQSCSQPLIWKTSPPKLAANNTTDLTASKWKMWVQAVNVDNMDKALLGTVPSDGAFNCTSDVSEPCTISFTIPIGKIGSANDWMSFEVIDHNGTEIGPRASITNILANMKPIITQIADDRKTWSGRNLVFNTIRVGTSTSITVDCLPDGSQCNGDGNYGKATGFLYFVANQGLAFQFNQINATGTNTGVTYTPPKPPAQQGQQQGQPTPTSSSGALALQDFKSSPQLKSLLNMQAVQ